MINISDFLQLNQVFHLLGEESPNQIRLNWSHTKNISLFKWFFCSNQIRCFCPVHILGILIIKLELLHFIVLKLINTCYSSLVISSHTDASNLLSIFEAISLHRAIWCRFLFVFSLIDSCLLITTLDSLIILKLAFVSLNTAGLSILLLLIQYYTVSHNFEVSLSNWGIITEKITSLRLLLLTTEHTQKHYWFSYL